MIVFLSPLEHEDGGLLSDEVVGAARALMRDACLSQYKVAGMIGFSKPQLTNVPQPRYGLNHKPYMQGIIPHVIYSGSIPGCRGITQRYLDHRRVF